MLFFLHNLTFMMVGDFVWIFAKELKSSDKSEMDCDPTHVIMLLLNIRKRREVLLYKRFITRDGSHRVEVLQPNASKHDLKS